MSSGEVPSVQNTISWLIPLLSVAVMTVLWITTKFGKTETKGAVTTYQLSQMLKAMEDDRDREKEQNKEIRQDLRQLSNTIHNLNNTLTLHAHIFNENKEALLDMQKRLLEVEKAIIELKRYNGRS